MTPAIQAMSLSKTYKGGKVRALDGVNLGAGEGEVLGIIGPNGSGKTSLMGCLLGLLRLDEGQALIHGFHPHSIEARKVVGYLPERLRFDSWMTGRRFLEFHYELSGRAMPSRDNSVESCLQDVGLESAAWDRAIKGYSRGMLQRIGLAQALIGNPRCLFLDEPTSGMDPEGAIATRGLLKDFSREGGTVIINSHQLEQVSKICDRVAFLRDGRLEETRALKGAGVALKFRARWLASGPASRLHKDRLAALLARAGVELTSLKGREVLYDAPDEESGARALSVLMRAGLKVIEAREERGDLETMFHREGRP